MAALAARAAVVAPVAGLGVPLRNRSVARPKSAFVSSSRTAFGLKASNARVVCFDTDFERKFGDPIVPGISLVGWLLPSSIPAIGGKSLSELFFSSIGPELAHWPTGPSLDSPFWLWLVTWHIGLFAVLWWGQIGVSARKQGGYL